MPVTKKTRQEKSSTFSTLKVIGVRRCLAEQAFFSFPAEFSLSPRRTQSTLVAKATRQESSIKSFKILMDIGPPMQQSSPPVAHDNTLAKQ